MVDDIPDQFGGYFTRNGLLLTQPYSYPLTTLTFQLRRFTAGQEPAPLSPPTDFGHIAGDSASWFFVFPNDGRRMAVVAPDRTPTGGTEYTIELWDIGDPASPRRVENLYGTPGQPIVAAAVTSDSRTLVAFSGHTLQTWDISVPGHARRLSTSTDTHGFDIRSLDISPDDRYLATGEGDSTVRLWDFTDRAHPVPLGHSITPPSTTQWTVSFDGPNRLLGTGNRVMSIWDLDEKHAIARICAVASAALDRSAWQTHVPALRYAPVCEHAGG